MKYKKGESGNPAGRPPGTLNKTTIIVQKLLASEAEEIGRSVIKMAKEGDFQYQRLLWNHNDGMPKQAHEVSGPGGKDLVVRYKAVEPEDEDDEG